MCITCVLGLATRCNSKYIVCRRFDEVAKELCRRLGYMCSADREFVSVLVGDRAPQTSLLLYSIGGEGLIADYLDGEKCLRKLIDTVNTATDLHIRVQQILHTRSQYKWEQRPSPRDS